MSDHPVVHHVRQKHAWGCGIACLAMVTGDSYDDIYALVRSYIEGCEDSRKGIHEYHLRDYLNLRGFAYQQVPHFSALENIKREPWPPKPWAPVHIVQVFAGSYHFVVMDEVGRVFDPNAEVRTRLDHPDYRDIYYVLGLWKVRP